MATSTPETTAQAVRVAGFQSATIRAGAFVLGNPGRTLGLSVLLLVPCYWHTHLEAGDLGSHSYNAWLTQLVRQGKAPGLWIARQWTNVLFDVALERLGGLFGTAAAEKIAVSAAVLIFFWGAFALAGEMGQRRPWTLTPVLAMLAYGWTFSMGFFNFYLSLGLSFIALALLWDGGTADAVLALALTPLIWLAHPLGLAWLAAAALYAKIAKKLRPERQWLLMAGAAASVLAAGLLMTLRWRSLFWNFPIYLRNGADQLIVYSGAYATVALLLVTAAAAVLGISAGQRWASGDRQLRIAVPSQMYLLAVWALVALPDAVFLPAYPAPATMIMERFSLVTGVFGCGMLAGVKPQRVHALVFTLIALFFFGLCYEDTQRINAMEEQAQKLVAQLPAGQRVIATIYPPLGMRVYVQHIVDRACIGRCFVYDNYEPSSRQFRLRARAGNGLAAANGMDVIQMQAGSYTVRSSDPPLYQIFQCERGGTRLCMRALAAGESTGLGK